MWEFDSYGNAENPETDEEFYFSLFRDGLVRVYKNDKIISVFHNVQDAIDFIKKEVSELESGEE